MVFDLDSWAGVGLSMWSPMAVVSIPMKWLVAPMSLWVWPMQWMVQKAISVRHFELLMTR